MIFFFFLLTLNPSGKARIPTPAKILMELNTDWIKLDLIWRCWRCRSDESWYVSAMVEVRLWFEDILVSGGWSLINEVRSSWRVPMEFRLYLQNKCRFSHFLKPVYPWSFHTHATVCIPIIVYLRRAWSNRDPIIRSVSLSSPILNQKSCWLVSNIINSIIKKDVKLTK